MQEQHFLVYCRPDPYSTAYHSWKKPNLCSYAFDCGSFSWLFRLIPYLQNLSPVLSYWQV